MDVPIQVHVEGVRGAHVEPHPLLLPLVRPHTGHLSGHEGGWTLHIGTRRGAELTSDCLTVEVEIARPGGRKQLQHCPATGRATKRLKSK